MGMELAMNELPLALFSTFAPMGAGAFLILAIASFTGSFEGEVARKLDKLSVIPIIFVVVSFICAFFHLAAPQHALGVFANIGSSPMSNEILVGCIFTVVAIVSWIVLVCAKPSDGLRKALLSITAVLGLLFCIFVGLAYGMNTIQSWDVPVVPLATLCYGVLGGSAIGLAILQQAGAYDVNSPIKSTIAIIAIVGALGSAIFFGIQMVMVSGMANNMILGQDLVGQLMPWIVIAVILMLASGAIAAFPALKSKGATYAWVAVAIAFIGILVARLCFYGVEMSVGLGI